MKSWIRTVYSCLLRERPILRLSSIAFNGIRIDFGRRKTMQEIIDDIVEKIYE